MKLPGDAAPVKMHVETERRRGRVVRETPCLAGALGKRKAESSVFGGHRHLQVAGLLQIFEILGKKPILSIVDRRPLVDAFEKLVGKDRLGFGGHH